LPGRFHVLLAMERPGGVLVIGLASAAVGTAWLCIVLVSRGSSQDELVFGPPGQVAALLLLAGAVLALLHFRSRFSYDTRRSS